MSVPASSETSKTRRWFRSGIFLLLGLGLLGWTLFRQDFGAVWEYVKKANYLYLVLVLLVAVAGHWIRALRWKLLIEQLGHKPSGFRVFLALMSGYLVNLGIPRLGEVTRCGSLWRSDKIPFAGLLGTVITERVIDVVFLVLFAIFSFSLQYARLENYLQVNIWQPLEVVMQEKAGLMKILLLGAGVVGVILLILGIVFFSRIRKWLAAKVVVNFREGLLSLLHLGKGPGGPLRLAKFLGFTLLIWLGYFLMTWLWFFAFPETAGLGVVTALFIWTIANISRTLPIHGGGLGAFHFLVTAAFVLFAVEESLAFAIATLMHATQTFFYLLVGGGSWLWMMGVVQGKADHSVGKKKRVFPPS